MGRVAGFRICSGGNFSGRDEKNFFIHRFLYKKTPGTVRCRAPNSLDAGYEFMTFLSTFQEREAAAKGQNR